MSGYAGFYQRYTDYVKGFRLPDGTLSEPMQRKFEHTMEVVEFAERIASAEQADEQEMLCCKLSALFHDTARYKQVALHHSFNDTESKFDHGHEGARILLECDLLSGLPADAACAVLTAVELHNKPVVDFSRLGGIFSAPVKNVRDADKLSILNLLTAYITGELKFEDSSVFLLKCADSPEITPVVLQNVLEGRPVLYKDLRSINDFKLSLFSWSRDLNFAESARIVMEHRFYERIREKLPDISGIDIIYKNTMDVLKCLSLKSGN